VPQKVLILNNRVPYPLKDGGAKASYSLITGLIASGLQVDLFFLNTKKHFVENEIITEIFKGANNIWIADMDTDVTIPGALRSFIKGTSYNIARFDQPHAHQLLKKILSENQYHIIHFETLYMAPYLNTVRNFSSSKCVLRMHNVEHQIWEKLAESASSGLKKTYLSHLSKKLKAYEELAIAKFDGIMPISIQDANWTKKHTAVPLSVIPMGIMVKGLPTINAGKHFFHIGSMEWLPNQEGCETLVKEVWPKVIEQDKECHLHLAGKGMGSRFKAWESSTIHVHGEVESAEDFMNAHNCMIIPLKSASGLRIKALEAMSYGKPIISTEIGMSGIEINEGENCVIANTVPEQVSNILKLANDDKLYKLIGENGYNFVVNEYAYQQVNDKTLQFYENIIE
jgi:glycosyltransferase involved in cell wall biosynthesis